jgi:hypothetical protein
LKVVSAHNNNDESPREQLVFILCMIEIEQLRKEKSELIHSYEELEQQVKAKEVHS